MCLTVHVNQLPLDEPDDYGDATEGMGLLSLDENREVDISFPQLLL